MDNQAYDLEIKREQEALANIETPDQDDTGGISMLGCVFLYSIIIAGIGVACWITVP